MKYLKRMVDSPSDLFLDYLKNGEVIRRIKWEDDHELGIKTDI
jgi:hypothetical protein